MTSYATGNLCRQIACFRSPPTPTPSPPPTACEIEPYDCNPEVVSRSAGMFNHSSKTEGPRRSSKKIDLAVTVWKQCRLPREDLASVANRRSFVRHRSPRGSSRRDATHFCYGYVRHLSISPSVISAGWFYFGAAILFYFIVSSAVL